MRAPRSVTVLWDTCTEAGLLATLAMLHGDRAEEFLAEKGVQNGVIRWESTGSRKGRPKEYIAIVGL